MGEINRTYKLFYGRVDENGDIIEGTLKELPDCSEISVSLPIIDKSEILRTENKELKEKIEDLEYEIDDLVDKNDKLIDQLEWVKANPREHRIIKERDELKEMVEYYKKVSDEFGKLSVKYANELNETRIKLKEIQKENKELKSDREKLRNRIIEINKEYDEDVAAYVDDIEDLYLQIDNLDTENTLLKEQAKDHEICYRDLENNWNSIYEQNQRLKEEVEVLKADNKDLEDCYELHCRLNRQWDDRCKELEKKLKDTEHMRDQYRILYDKYQTLFSVTEEMALGLNKLLDDTYDIADNANCFHTCYASRIKECIKPQSDIITTWSATMDRERTYYDKQLGVAYRKSRESK